MGSTILAVVPLHVPLATAHHSCKSWSCTLYLQSEPHEPDMLQNADTIAPHIICNIADFIVQLICMIFSTWLLQMAARGAAITIFPMYRATMQTAVAVAVHLVWQSRPLFSGSCSILRQLLNSARGTSQTVFIHRTLLVSGPMSHCKQRLPILIVHANNALPLLLGVHR